MFKYRHVARQTYPQKHILICEDDLTCQKRILEHLLSIFDPQGIVQFSIVCGAIHAASIISNTKIDLIILDHDMPQGNGTDLLNWLKDKHNIPVITFSGIPYNNVNMMTLGAHHLYQKEEVIGGKADDIIKSYINETTINNIKIAEHYVNTFTSTGITIPRYWITPNILVGGNVLDEQDLHHLENDFGIKGFINVDRKMEFIKENDYKFLQFYVADEGAGFPEEKVHQVVKFAEAHAGHPIYINCHIGFSRSPHFAYSVLRHCYNMNEKEAMARILQSLPSVQHHNGFNTHTKNYIPSIERALSSL